MSRRKRGAAARFVLLPPPGAGVEVVERTTSEKAWSGTPAEQAERLERLRDALARDNPDPAAIREAADLAHRLALVLREQVARAGGRREREVTPDGDPLWSEGEGRAWKPADLGREFSAAVGVRAGKAGRRDPTTVRWEHAALAASLTLRRGHWPDGCWSGERWPGDPYPGEDRVLVGVTPCSPPPKNIDEMAGMIGAKLSKSEEHVRDVLKAWKVRCNGEDVGHDDPLPEEVLRWCLLAWAPAAPSGSGVDSLTNVPPDTEQGTLDHRGMTCSTVPRAVHEGCQHEPEPRTPADP